MWPVSVVDHLAGVRDRLGEARRVAQLIRRSFVPHTTSVGQEISGRRGRRSYSRIASSAERKPSVPAPRSCSAASGSRQAAAGGRRRPASTSPPGARPGGEAVRVGGGPRRAEREQLLAAADRRHRARSSSRFAVGRDAGGGDEHEPLDARGRAAASSALISPPIELPTSTAARCRARPSSVGEDARVAGHRDFAGVAGRVAEAGQVEGDHAVARENTASCSSQFGQQPDRPWTNTIAGSPEPELDRVDRALADVHPALMPAPVDLLPGGFGGRVVLGGRRVL